MLAKPTVNEILFLYLEVSDAAVSLVLIKEEGSTQKAIYYISTNMTDPKSRLLEIEKLTLNLIIAS